MIINAQYFQTKELYIPNSVAQPSIGSVSPSAITQLNEEIESIEQSLLLDILGATQLAELNEQFEETDGVWAFKDDALQKWIDFVDGKDDWKGLRYSIGSKNISLIAYYVFFYYLSMDFQNYTTNGMIISRTENSFTNEPSIKQVSIWNKFIKMYIGNGINTRPRVTNNWNGQYLSFIGEKMTNEVSLYDFLHKNKDVYDISKFIIKRPLNYIGL